MCFRISKKDENRKSPRSQTLKVKGSGEGNCFMVALDSLPKDYRKTKIKLISKQFAIAEMRGPDKDEGLHIFKEMVAAQTISTYPHFDGQTERDGDPICDYFAINIYNDRLLVGVADGCGWGSKPRAAATNGTKTFMDYVSKHLEEAKTVKDASIILLDAMDQAHNAIITQKENYWEVGTTTLLAGVVLPLQDENESYGFLFTSVGDSKAFYYNHKNKTIDLSKGNRPNWADPTDCGGRMGPQLDGGKPDLRNLTIIFQPCNEGDLFLVVSDGIHDNLDPQYLGKSPTEVSIPKEKWDEIDPILAESVRDNYRQDFITKFIENNSGEPQAIVTDILKHCQVTTQSSRDFMLSNIGKKLPSDYVLYPGKMDHTTCVIFKIGSYK